MPRRPRNLILEPATVRPLRPPRASDQERWYWQARATVDGCRIVVWSGWATPQEARRAVASALARGPVGPQVFAVRDVRTVRDLLRYWLGGQQERPELSAYTRRGYRSSARRIAAALGPCQLSRLDQPAIERWRADALRRYAPATVRADLSVLRAAWSWGRSVGLCQDRSLPAIRVAGGPVRLRTTPSAADVAAVAAHLDGWPRIALLLLAGTGARIGEIAALRWDDVVLARGRATATLCGKTGTRTVPLLGDLPAVLEAWKREQPENASRVLGVAHATVTSEFGPRLLADACSRADVPRFTPHGLRRAAVDALARAGADVAAAAALLGHSPSVMWDHYRNVTSDDIRSAGEVARLGQLPAGAVVPFPGSEVGSARRK